MKVGISTWNEKISPVFDVAQYLAIVDIKDNMVLSRIEHKIKERMPVLRALEIQKLGINTLICGAISRPLLEILDSMDIEVIPWMSGKTDDILEAFLHDRLMKKRFMMPPFRFRRRQRKRGCKRHYQ